MESVTITAGGRSLSLVGRHPTYMQGIEGANTDKGPIAAAIADVPSDSTLLDVGANIGFTALPMAVQRPDCRVVAFEPVPSNAECLRRNIQDNSIENIEVIEAVVGDTAGTVEMSDNGPWSVASAGGTVRCRSIVLDDFCSASTRFVKIDVEGYEPNVLAGAARLLNQQKPLIFIEFNTWTLLLHHYDPLSFAEALWSQCDIISLYFADKNQALPSTSLGFLHTNMTEHHLVSDILIRPRGALDLGVMTKTPYTRHLEKELKDLYPSPFGRIMSRLRASRRFFRRPVRF